MVYICCYVHKIPLYRLLERDSARTPWYALPNACCTPIPVVRCLCSQKEEEEDDDDDDDDSECL